MKENGHAESNTVREEETECGIGKFRPNCLQHFANINVFVGVYSVILMVSQILNIYINTQVPSLERQFGLNSGQTGLVMAFNDIGFFAVILFISAAAPFVHIPRVLFLSVFLLGISGLICSLPYVVTVSKGLLPTLNFTSTITNSTNGKGQINLLCQSERNLTDNICDSNLEQENNALAAPSYSIRTLALSLIGIGMTLQGIGKAPRVPYYMVYIDDNVDRRKTGFYSGIATFFLMIGPTLAFMIGGKFSRMYLTLEDVDMDPRDPRWIGAWWLGFVVVGAVNLVLALPLPFFPRRLKMFPKDIARGNFQSRPSIQEHSSSILEKLKTGAFSASLAIGTLLGGFLTRKIKMTPRNVHGMILVFYVLHTIFLGIAMVMDCPQPTIIGPHQTIPGYVSVTCQNCSLDCACQDDNFYPICGSNKAIYHSPCFAGCKASLRSGRMFANCSCIPDGRAEAGLCDDRCFNLTPWSIFVFLHSIIAGLTIAPNIIAVIRSVDERDKAAALGLNTCLGSGLAWALSPILYGKAIDASCRIWQYPCSSSGACELYDLRSLRLSFHGLSIALKMVALAGWICLVIMTRNWDDWKFSKKAETTIYSINTADASSEQQDPVAG